MTWGCRDEGVHTESYVADIAPDAGEKYMTFGLTDKANLTREDGAQHQLLESAWYFTALDDATEAKLSAIMRKAAS